MAAENVAIVTGGAGQAIMEASYVHSAAACPNCTIRSDIFGRLVREHDLLKTPLSFNGKWIDVPTGAGLGVHLDEDALAEYSHEQVSVSES